MMSAWMIYAVVLALFACLAALAAEHLMWMWRAPRRLPWLTALGIAVIGPLVLPIMRSAHAPIPTAVARTIHVDNDHLTNSVARRDATTNAERTDLYARARLSSPSAVTMLLEPFLIRGWLVVSVIGVLALLIMYARLHRQRAAWPELELDGTRVLVAPSQGPAVVGVWRPHIVIPEWSLSLDVTARSFMLQHEREHVATRDPQCLFLAALALGLFPWNVPLWLIVRGLRRTIELDCDDRVLWGGRDVERYGSLLLQFAAHRVRPPSLAAGLIERQSLLERRIRVMTATRPRRPLLVSVPLVLGIAIATLGAARTNVPRSPFTGTSARGSTGAKRAVGAPSAAVVERAPIAAPLGTGKSEVQLPHVRSEPKINADWENAPIQNVIAVFASFSHRRIIASPDVVGFISAHIVDQPWTTALKNIMAAYGFRVTFNADSSVTISLEKPVRDSVPSERVERPASSREITGTVTDAATGQGISGARVNVAGTLAIGEPNEASTNDRGQFSLRGPDGEVWLDACATGYEFTRVTLAPADSVANFHGRRMETLVRDTALYGSIIDSPRVAGIAVQPVYVVDGRVVGAATSTRRGCGLHRISDLRYGGLIWWRVAR
jgi:beta-lactamase regulating signal transducer with metallopeptidase domain